MDSQCDGPYVSATSLWHRICFWANGAGFSRGRLDRFPASRESSCLSILHFRRWLRARIFPLHVGEGRFLAGWMALKRDGLFRFCLSDLQQFGWPFWPLPTSAVICTPMFWKHGRSDAHLNGVVLNILR